MPQLNKGDTFADGQQVTGNRLNQLVDSATLTPGAITEQSGVTVNDIQTADQLLIYDNSATGLRKATVGDVFGANIPLNAESITANTLTARANQDLIFTPNDTTSVVNRSYTSSISGEITSVTVTHTAHGLSVGSFVQVNSATNTNLNGLNLITSVPTVDTFIYSFFGVTTAGSGTLTYFKDGTIRAAGSLNVTGAFISSSNITVGGNAHFNGTGALRLPNGTTAQRPAATSVGMIRYNSTTNQPEIYNGVVWERFGSVVKAANLFFRASGYNNYAYRAANVYTNVQFSHIKQTDNFVVNAGSFPNANVALVDFSTVIPASAPDSFELPAGTYTIVSSGQIQANGGSAGLKIRLFNSTDLTTIDVGSFTYCTGASNGTSSLVSTFTITGSKVLRLQFMVIDAGSATYSPYGTIAQGTDVVFFPTLITKIS